MQIEPLNPLPSSLLKHDHTVRALRMLTTQRAAATPRKATSSARSSTSTKAEVITSNSYGTTAAIETATESPCPRLWATLPEKPEAPPWKSQARRKYQAQYCLFLTFYIYRYVSAPARNFCPVRAHITGTTAAERSPIVIVLRRVRPHNICVLLSSRMLYVSG